MNREKNLEEMCRAMAGGGVIGAICLSFVNQELHGPLDLLAYWIATWMISTYCVWSVIDWIDRARNKKKAAKPGKALAAK